MGNDDSFHDYVMMEVFRFVAKVSLDRIGHKGKDVTLSYWELPAEIMEDRDELEKWIEKSVKAQINSKNK